MARVQGPWLGAGVGVFVQLRARRGPLGIHVVVAETGRQPGRQDDCRAWRDVVRHRLVGRSQLLNHRRTLVENTFHTYGDSEFESQFLPGSAQQFPWQVTSGTPCALFNQLRLEDSGHQDTEVVLKSNCKYISFNDSGKNQASGKQSSKTTTTVVSLVSKCGPDR